jgi:hypothetical protein
VSDNVGPKKELVNRIQEGSLFADWRGKWEVSAELCDGEESVVERKTTIRILSNVARNPNERNRNRT